MNNTDTKLNELDNNKPGRKPLFYILKRQRLKILLSFLSVLIVTVVISLAIPTEYRSIATLLIQDYEMPQDLLPSAITTHAVQELQVINQQIMTRTKLAEIIEKFRLYPEFQDKLSKEEIVDEMRKDIKIEFINAERIDPSTTGREGTATIAFTLSYGGKNPSRVQEVANSLTSLFLEENFKRRSIQAANEPPFFENEIEDYQTRLAIIDKEISGLKEANFEKFPEAASTLQSIDRLERKISNYNNSIKTLYDRKAYLEGQLAILTSDTPSKDNEGLNNTEEEAVKDDITGLEDENETVKETEPTNNNSMTDSRDAPSYLSLKTQITQADIEIREAEKERSVTKEKLSAYQLKLDNMPEIAQEYMSLLRDRANIEAKFHEAKDKLMQGKLSEGVATTQNEGAFVILDPPVLPEEPYKPKRLTIFVIGTVLALGTSIGIGFLSDILNNSKGKVSSKLKDPDLLADIPVIAAPGDIKNKRKKLIVISISLVALFIIMLILFKIFIIPLDLLWIKIIRKIDKFIVVTLN